MKRLDPEALKSTLENAEIVLSKPMRIDQFKFNLNYIDGNANLEASQ
ncbi:hypothetical protein L0337_20430 [candidate division KSB1 bacterium]|nr:hypothetical protein [candidate division KSB1 bacterium]